MFKRLLGKSLAELPAMERMLILMPLIALGVLTTVIMILWNKLGSSNDAGIKQKDAQIIYWQKVSEGKDRIIEQKSLRIDSLITKAYNDKVKTNEELERIIQRQDKQKRLLRSIK